MKKRNDTSRGERGGSLWKSRIIGGIVAAVIVLVMFWFMLPPINLTSPVFWRFAVLSLIVFLVCMSVGELRGAAASAGTSEVEIGGVKVHKPNLPSFKRSSRMIKGFLFTIGGIVALMVLVSVFGAEIFHAGSYKDLLQKTDGNFTEDVAELSMNQIPVVDRDSSIQLGKRKLGEMSDLVSQFEISEEYTQINYQNRPVRVTPLVYGDLFKWFNNQSEGVPAYIKVDMVSQETTLVRLEKGMKYAPCEFLLRDLQRHLRFNYPTKIFETYSFEIDEEGTPYWIAPTVRYRIGLWNGRDIEGAVLVNAITGEHRYYAVEDIPTWADQVYNAGIILEQLTWNGKYQSGFWNANFGQKGVLRPTDGYNYIAVNDDVYLYTGMTSVAGDQSNVGFVLVNMRTKDTKFYTISGAEENSAMSSAQGRVQDQGYKATFPLLLNVSNRPTYFMSLKDNSGLVKMYAFVDVKRYQLVGLGSTVQEAKADYERVLNKEEGVQSGDTEEKTGVVKEIHDVVLEGNTSYYLQLEQEERIFVASVEVSPELPFLTAGDRVKLTYKGDEDSRTMEVITIQRTE